MVEGGSGSNMFCLMFDYCICDMLNEFFDLWWSVFVDSIMFFFSFKYFNWIFFFDFSFGMFLFGIGMIYVVMEESSWISFFWLFFLFGWVVFVFFYLFYYNMSGYVVYWEFFSYSGSFWK